MTEEQVEVFVEERKWDYRSAHIRSLRTILTAL